MISGISITALLGLSTLISSTSAAPSFTAESSVRRPAPRCQLQLDPSRRLQFVNGVFRSTIFTDLHYGEAQGTEWQPWGIEQDVNSSRVMKTVLDIEKPHFVIFNGDQVTGEGLLYDNATVAYDRALETTVRARKPFAAIYGNHDNSINISHSRLFDHEKKEYAKWSMTQKNPDSADDQNGAYNYVLPVFADDKAKQPSLLLWFFDSRSGIFDDPDKYQDWVDPKVAKWIKSTSDCVLSTYKLSSLPVSLSFVHIPVNRATQLQHTLVDPNPKYPGINDDSPLDPQGQHHPEVKEPDAAFWNALHEVLNGKEGNGLIATVFGHDHGNDWCAKSTSRPWNHCFARHSGYGGYGSRTRGSRVIEVRTSMDHKKGGVQQAIVADSWIRLETGNKANGTTLWGA